MLIKFVKFISWVAGIVLIFFGILGITDSATGSVLTIVSGILITPLTYTIIKKFLPMGNVTRVILAGVLFAIGAPLMINNGATDLQQKNNFIAHNEKSMETAETLNQTLEKADLETVDAISALTSRLYDEASQKAIDIITNLNQPLTQSRAAGDETAVNNILARHIHALLIYKTSQLLRQKDTIFADMEQAEIADLIPQLELLERGYRENSQDWNDAADFIEELGTDNLSENTLKNFHLIASTQKGFAEDFHKKISEFREIVPNYVPVEEKVIPKTLLPFAEGNMTTPELKKFFGEFDADGDSKLSMKEAQDFFYWVEDNITYRYDDEQESNPFVGTLVGDGRPGADSRQTPSETYDERAGDCEDMSTFEQAFYKFFGIDAYVVGVNAENPSSIDHASTVVRIAGHVQEFKDFLGNVFYYEVNDSTKDVFGNPVPPGEYMVVDNSYSAAFGYISGGVMEGKYKVHCAIPLERGYGDEWETVKDRCSVDMD